MPPFRPNSMRDGKARASALRRMFLNAKSDEPNSSSQFIVARSASNSSASMPVANAPPTRPPMLVPAATSMGMRCSSNHRITPTCAMPRALPPPNATPTTGRPWTVCRAAASAPVAGRAGETAGGRTITLAQPAVPAARAHTSIHAHRDDRPCVDQHSVCPAHGRRKVSRAVDTGLSSCSPRRAEVNYRFTGPWGRLYGMRRTAARSLVNFSLRTASGPEGSSAK